MQHFLDFPTRGPFSLLSLAVNEGKSTCPHTGHSLQDLHPRLGPLCCLQRYTYLRSSVAPVCRVSSSLRACVCAGGLTHGMRTRSVEAYSVADDRWTRRADLARGRSGCRLVRGRGEAPAGPCTGSRAASSNSEAHYYLHLFSRSVPACSGALGRRSDLMQTFRLMAAFNNCDTSRKYSQLARSSGQQGRLLEWMLRG